MSRTRLTGIAASTLAALLYLQSPVWASDIVEAVQLLKVIQTGNIREFHPAVGPHPEIVSSNWPIHTFLLGEILRMRGEDSRAKEAYRSLVDWSLGDPYSDKTGGTGLSGIALWRLLQEPVKHIAKRADYARYLLDVGQKLLVMPAVRNLFAVPTLKTRIVLARFSEDILRRMIRLAREVGDGNLATRLFLRSLRFRTNSRFSVFERKLLGKAVAEGRLTKADLALRVGKTLMRFGEGYDAAGAIQTAYEIGQTAQMKAEAGLLLARLWRFEGRPRKDIIKLLDSVVDRLNGLSGTDDIKPDIHEEVLFYRAIRHNREGVDRDVARARADFQTIIHRFPDGKRADDALIELARSYEEKGDLDAALMYYGQLQDWVRKGRRHGREDSAYYMPGLMLYGIGGPENLKRAKTLFEALEKKGPSGALYIPALFWLGRLYEEEGDGEKAREYFKKIVVRKRNAVDYYGVRALMHLNRGQRASRLLFSDEVTEGILRTHYERAERTLQMAAREDAKDRPYGERVSWAVNTGLYELALKGGRGMLIRKGVSVGLRQNPFFLDRSGTLASVVTHIALQQDAVRAGKRGDGALVAWQLTQAGDPTAGLMVLSLAGSRSNGRLVVEYPRAYSQLFQERGMQYGVQPSCFTRLFGTRVTFHRQLFREQARWVYFSSYRQRFIR